MSHDTREWGRHRLLGVGTPSEIRRAFALLTIVGIGAFLLIFHVVLTDDVLYYQQETAQLWVTVQQLIGLVLTAVSVYVLVRGVVRRDLDYATVGLAAAIVVNTISPFLGIALPVEYMYGLLAYGGALVAYEFVREEESVS